jgi:hypothetical protein
MPVLRYFLVLKIAVTALLWCLPLLAFPPHWFVALGLPVPQPLLFSRLLGAAYLALLAGYACGIREIDRGGFPQAAVTGGIAGNGLAFAVLAVHGGSGSWSTWSAGAQWFMWISTVGALIMTVALAMFLLGERRLHKR